MGKLKAGQITAADLKEYEDSSSDFSFELRMLQRLSLKKWECEHGGSYTDPVTGKSRQFDIRAQYFSNRRVFRLAAECKNIRENFPLLIQCVPRLGVEAFHDIMVAFNRDLIERSKMQLRLRDPFSQCLRIGMARTLYPPGQIVGKSFSQVGREFQSPNSITSNNAEVNEKWGQCLASATELVARSQPSELPNGMAYLTAILPVIVVPNDRLWVSHYDRDGALIHPPVMSDEITYFVGHTVKPNVLSCLEGFNFSHIHIVTETGFRNLRGLIESGEFTERIFPMDSLEQAWRAFLFGRY